jgi:hypothetical protein
MRNLFKLALALLALALSGFDSYSQQSWQEKMLDRNVPIQEVKGSFEQEWQGKEIVRGKGYKQFKRWEWFMEQRCYPSGIRFAPDAVFVAMQEAPQMFQSNSMMPGDWQYIGNTSIPTGGGGAGRINNVRNEPGSSTTFYGCAPGGGVWKTTNSGVSWTVLNTDFLSSIGVSDIAIDPNNVNTIYIATGDGDAGDTYSLGVLKSTDGGLTWNTTGLSWSVGNQRTTSRIMIDPSNSNTLIVATSNGIYRSTDGGANFTQEQTGSFKDLEFHPTNSNIIYASGGSFYRSTNNGQDWTQVTTGLPTTNLSRMALAVSIDEPDYVYILAGNSSYGLRGVYRSIDAGLNWTARYTGPLNLMGYDPNGLDAGGQAWYDIAIEADPTNAEIIYTGGVNIYKSSNGGTNWSLNAHWYGGGGAPYVHADIHSLYFVPGTSRLLVGCDGGVFTTTNGGTSYSDISSNLQIAQQYRLGLSTGSQNLVITGWQDNGTNLKNGAVHTRPIGGDGMECIINPTTTSIMYGELYYGDIRKSTNGGISFGTQVCTSGGTGVNEDGAWVTPYVLGSANADHLYVGKTRVYKSINGGASFTTLGAMGSGVLNSLCVAQANNDYIYGSKAGTLYVSSDNGATFVTSSGLPGGYITYITTNPSNAQEVYVTISGFTNGSKVYKSVNAGTSWTNISGNLPNIPANCIVYQAGTSGGIYVGTDAGVYYRDDVLNTWIPYMNNLPNVEVTELEIHYASNTIVAATYGRGLWSAPLYSLPSLDVTISDVISPVGTVCDAEITPQITILNAGSDAVTQMQISTTVGANVPVQYIWTGNLASGATTTITLPTYNYGNGAFTVEFEVVSVNGTDDENLSNNSATSSYNVTGGVNLVNLHILTDCYPTETTWEILSGGVPIYESTGLAGQVENIIPLCLPDGCFDFIIYDSYGDGLTSTGCPDGSYWMTNADDGSFVFAPQDPAFGFSATEVFCFNQAIPGCIDVNACNYDPTAGVDDGSCVYGPANDVCSGAIPLVANQAPITVTNATSCFNGSNPGCGGQTQIQDIWYSFVYNGGDVILETSAGSLPGSEPITDTRMAVRAGSCSGAVIACNDDNIGLFSTIELGCADLSVGQTYYVQVGGFQGLTGSFQLEYLVGDVYGCTSSGSSNYDACATIDDGTCIVEGCTDALASNFNPAANTDDGSCLFEGCTDPIAANFNPNADTDDGSCEYEGCTNPIAANYDPIATIDDGSCIILGCTNPLATNYNPLANTDNGSCIIPGCTNPIADNYNPTATTDNGSCIISGCTNPVATNYNPLANTDNGSCIIPGCTNPIADNYNPVATTDNGSCVISGCTNPLASNYNPLANNDNGSCIIPGCTNALACNYNPLANQNNGTCILPVTYYQDFDGDTYGNSSVTISSCTPVAGYVLNSTDCNDSNNAIRPGAVELCDGVDNNCNTLIDEGCNGEFAANDDIAGAAPVVIQQYNNCATISGDLSEASPSPDAIAACITGEDLWYSFTAVTSGIRVNTTSSSANILIELQDANGQMMDVENLQSGLGNEVLNFGGLTPGDTYYVGVRNYNSAQGTGQFNICLSYFLESSCNYNNPSFSLCSVFKAVHTGTSNYQFEFTPVGGGETLTYDSFGSTKILLEWVDGLGYNQAYNVTINSIYSVTNGLGQTENLIVQGNNTCTMNIGAPAVVSLRASDACPAVKSINQLVMCNPRVCGALGYEFELVRTDVAGAPFYVSTSNGSRYMQLTAANGFVMGATYNVRVRPIVASGAIIPFGPVSCIQIAGPANGFVLDGNSNSAVDFVLFPNPANNMINIDFNTNINDVLELRLLDLTGKIVLQEVIVFAGESRKMIELPITIPNGMYLFSLSKDDYQSKKPIVIIR